MPGVKIKLFRSAISPLSGEARLVAVYREQEQAVNTFLALLDPFDVLDVQTQAVVVGAQQHMHLHTQVTYRG